MPDQRIILVENPAHLTIHTGRLRLSREGMELVHILPQDIAVLVLHHHTIQLSVSVLQALGAAKVLFGWNVWQKTYNPPITPRWKGKPPAIIGRTYFLLDKGA